MNLADVNPGLRDLLQAHTIGLIGAINTLAQMAVKNGTRHSGNWQTTFAQQL